MRPMVAVVAVEEPDTAAKMPHASTLVCARRPGSRESHGARPVNIWLASLVRNRISPIRMKSGRAVSAQSVLPPNTVVESRAPGLVLVKKPTAAAPTRIIAIAIHKPAPSSMSSRIARNTLISPMFTRSRLVLVLGRPLVRRDAPAQHVDQVLEESDGDQRDAERHAGDRNPLRQRYLADGVFLEAPRVEGHHAGRPGEPRRYRGRGDEADDLERAPRAVRQMV